LILVGDALSFGRGGACGDARRRGDAAADDAHRRTAIDARAREDIVVAERLP
jgi:hypothetical protein